MKKKIVSAIMAAALVLSMAGCGTTAAPAAAPASDAAPAAGTEAAAPAEAPAETAEETTDASGDESYRVGVIQLVQHVALDAATEGFEAALTDKLGDKVSFDVQNASGDSANCATIANTFVSDSVDLIMANATASLQAASAATGTIPILGTSVTDYATALEIDDWNGTVGTNVSGTSDLAPLDQQADCIKEIFPDAKTVGILYCSAEANSAYQATTIHGYLEKLGYTVKEYNFSDSNDLSGVCTTACSEIDVLYIPTDNTAANNTELINNITTPAKIPVFCGEEGICKGCGVATLSISYYDLGYTTGEMAYEVLANGADISTMAVEYAPNVTKKYMADRAAELGVTIPDGYEAIEEE